MAEDFTRHFKQLYEDLASGKAAENEIPAEVNVRLAPPKAKGKPKEAASKVVGMASGIRLKENPQLDYLRKWEREHE